MIKRRIVRVSIMLTVFGLGDASAQIVTHNWFPVVETVLSDDTSGDGSTGGLIGTTGIGTFTLSLIHI